MSKTFIITLLTLAMAGCAGVQLRFLSETRLAGCPVIQKFKTSKGTEIACCRDAHEWLCYEIKKVTVGEIYLSSETPPIPRR